MTVAYWDARSTRTASWEAAGWSEHGQTQRFLAILRHLELRARDTVLDYGCGTGRFCEFLPREVEYHAYDASRLMRQRCRKDHERAHVHSRLDGMFDHVVAVGTFNLETPTRALVEVQKLWRLARRSLVVSVYRGTDERCGHHEARDIADLAERLSARFTVDGSYLDNDLLLAVYR